LEFGGRNFTNPAFLCNDAGTFWPSGAAPDASSFDGADNFMEYD
jgi:hypothetical protein